MRKIDFTPSAIPLNNFISVNSEKIYKSDVEYQREYVWKKEYQIELIFSIFQRMPIGTIIVWDNGNENEIIDGKQRITTIRNFKNNEIKINDEIARKIIHLYKEELIEYADDLSLKLLKKYNSTKKINLVYDDIPDFMKEYFSNYLISIVTIRYATSDQIRNYFVSVQNAESLKKGQIIKTKKDNEIVSYIQKKDPNKLTKKLNFNDINNDFVRILTMFHGVVNSKISLGCSNNSIMSYINKNEILSNKFQNRFDLFCEKLEDLNLLEFELNKSVLKLILSEVFFGEWWLNIDINKFINTFQKIYDDYKWMFNNQDINRDDQINLQYKSFILLTRGSHNAEFVNKTIKTIDSLLNK